MSWTKSGSVNLTNGNAVVYGNSTTWASGGKARAGDVFVGPAGALYEVLSVQSNTQLTLASNYLGATANAQSYALIHTGLLPAELAAGLSDLQSKYLTTISQLYEWETSTADTVPITNPATGVTANVKPLAKFLASIGDGSMAGSFTELSATGGQIYFDSTSGAFRFRTTGGLEKSAIRLSGDDLLVEDKDGNERTRVTTTGLSVTGSLSATGRLSTAGITEDASGKVGIGTSSPSTKLQVGASASGPGLKDTVYLGQSSTDTDQFRWLWNYAGSGLLGIGTSGTSMIFGRASGNAGTVSAEWMRLDSYGNLGLGVAPSAWASTWRAFEFGAGNGISSDQASAIHVTSNAYWNGTSWVYKASNKAANYYSQNGNHYWRTAPSGTAGQPISFTQAMMLDASGNLLVGNATPIDGGHSFKRASSNVASFYRTTSTTTDTLTSWWSDVGGTLSQKAFVQADGSLKNATNVYGAISDIKLKQDITDCTPKLAKLNQVRIVNYRLKSDPEHKQLGVIAQELEQIMPGLIDESPDYEDVVITPARTETKVTKKQAVEYREDVRYEIVEADGKWLKLPVRTTVEVPLFTDYPLFDEAGDAVMECIEPATGAVLNKDGEVITPAKSAVWQQAIHRVPVTEDVSEEVEVPAVIERRPTGTVTKSVKYSVFVPMLIKAVQEQSAIIEAMAGRIDALEGK